MKAKRTRTWAYYACVDCGRPVPQIAYRVSCPDCGGSLSAAMRARGGPW